MKTATNLVDPPADFPTRPEQRQEWPFMVNGSNYIGHASETLSHWVNSVGFPMFWLWNSTPFDGYPGDTADMIEGRHWDQRSLWQAAVKAGWDISHPYGERAKGTAS
jgi:hypothetical protein